MKNIRLIILTVILGMVFTSCKEDQFQVYNDSTKIFFNWGAKERYPTGPDSANYYLGTRLPVPADTIFEVAVTTIGLQSSFDRPIAFDIYYDDDYTTAKEEFYDYTYTEIYWDEIVEDTLTREVTVRIKDIERMPSVIEADSSTGKIRVKVFNNQRLSDVGAAGLQFRVRLLPNEHFTTDFTQTIFSNITNIDTLADGTQRYPTTMFRIKYDNQVGISRMWQDLAEGSTRAEMLRTFGEFSRVKVDFICDALGVPRDYFDPDPDEWETPKQYYNSHMDSTITQSYTRIYQVALKKYFDEHGHGLFDEAGIEILPEGTFS